MNTVQGIIRLSELTEILGVSATTVWRWRRENRIPQSLSLGPRMVGWRRKDIDEWLNQLSNERGVQ